MQEWVSWGRGAVLPVPTTPLGDSWGYVLVWKTLTHSGPVHGDLEHLSQHIYDNWKMDRQPMEDIPKGSVSVTVCELEVLALTWINLKH